MIRRYRHRRAARPARRADSVLVKTALLLSLVVSFASAEAACYQLYDRTGQLIYQDFRPPFDVAYDPALGPSPELEASRARGERLEILPTACASLTRPREDPSDTDAPRDAGDFFRWVPDAR